MTTLFDEPFFTDSWDQDIITYIANKGWEVTSEQNNYVDITDKHLVYGTGNNHFWSSDYEANELLDEGFKYLTKEQFKEKIGMVTVQKKLKPSDVKGYVKGTHQPYTDYNKEIEDWLKSNSDNTEFYSWDSGKFIFTGQATFYRHSSVFNNEVYYTNEEFKKLIGMDTTSDESDVLVPIKQKLDELYKEDPVAVRQYLKELDTREANIRKELEFAEAKKARLEKHIDVLKSKLQ